MRSFFQRIVPSAKSVAIASPFAYAAYSSNNAYNAEVEKNRVHVNRTVLKNDVSSKTVMSVSKEISRHWDTPNTNVYENEKKWLERLKDTGIIAKPLQYDDKKRMITTEYAGEKINKHNLPKDWEKQRDHILGTLKEYNCRHNDIKPDELLIQNGQIKVIDFGWAYDLNRKNPKGWPKELGTTFRCETGYDDRCSFDKVVEFVKRRE